MITKIKMNNVSSYKNSTSLETDKKVNLLYGLNGTGKSTLSNFLYNRSDDKFADCSVEGLKETDTILVYNQQFIKDNFYETEDIPGIFTLSKENKDIKELIDKARYELSKIKKDKEAVELEEKNVSEQYEKSIEDYKDKFWTLKKEFTGEDNVLGYCLDGLRSSKSVLFKYLVNLKKVEQEPDYELETLKSEAAELRSGVGKESSINKISLVEDKIENLELLEKVIVGNNNSTVSVVIDKLKNSDWVNKGLTYIDTDENPSICPFCQQKTISKEFVEQIYKYFDNSYEGDKNKLGFLLKDYSDKAFYIFNEVEKLKANRFLNNNNINDIERNLLTLDNLIKSNKSKIEDKIDTPSLSVTLESSEEVVSNINKIIEDANQRILEYNKKIENIEASRNKIKEKFWNLMQIRFDTVINDYNKKKIEYDNYIKEYNKKIEGLKKEIENQQSIIRENQKKTINIDEAVDNIKGALLDIGIMDFSIEKYSDEESLYHIKREACEEDHVFQTLSEGEKMVISFLYFLERCKGEVERDSTSTNKIIVIDDPISSLSHIHVFNIGRLIHNEFLRTDKYEQIFVLTHSLYFFYELTNINHEQRESTQKLFRLCKNEGGSSFNIMKYEEIQNDYQAYWHIIKDQNQPPALIANCMRNIIEYFFNFVEKQDYNNVFQKPELQKTNFMAFNRYMNRESHSKGQNIFDIKEFNYSDFKRAFELVFTHTGYSKHYKKMMK